MFPAHDIATSLPSHKMSHAAAKDDTSDSHAHWRLWATAIKQKQTWDTVTVQARIHNMKCTCSRVYAPFPAAHTWFHYYNQSCAHPVLPWHACCFYCLFIVCLPFAPSLPPGRVPSNISIHISDPGGLDLHRFSNLGPGHPLATRAWICPRLKPWTSFWYTG